MTEGNRERRRHVARVRSRCVITAAALALASMTLVAVAGAAAGDLDPTFGAGGKVLTDLAASDWAWAVAPQPDGRIVAAGCSGPGNCILDGGGDFALARYNADGSLDSSFGSGGKVLTDFGSGSSDGAFAVALQPDGRIVAAGFSDYDFALVRYNADGSLDASFGSGGKVSTDFPGDDRAWAVALQPDGRIVAAGTGGFANDFALVRYRVNGSLDSSFGSGGRVLTNLGYLDDAYALAVQSDGKIVAVGRTYAGGGNFALVRYKANGSLDPSFGSGGTVLTDLGAFDEALGGVLQPDGRIVAAGRSGLYAAFDFALVRYNADGGLDPSFGAGGKVFTDFGGGDAASAVALAPDAKIVAVGCGGEGNCNGSFTRGADVALARYNADGSLDASFGSGGKMLTDFGSGSSDGAAAVALQRDGRIVAVGVSDADGVGDDFAVARYLACLPSPVKEPGC